MKKATVFEQRRTGILLHITSLPSGTLGNDAYRFIDFLADCNVSVWQMLPLGPTHSDGSPYQCLSSHAGNQELICPQSLAAEYWAENLAVDLAAPITEVITKAYYLFKTKAKRVDLDSFDAFCEQHQHWLEDYVLFRQIRHIHDSKAWFDWPVELRQRLPDAIEKLQHEYSEALSIKRFKQYIFFRQWERLRAYANQKGINLFGDIPIFVAHDSADVWAEPDLFTLDDNGYSTRVAGVPPDYFSETGQRWGNPLFEWAQHIENDFDWWKRRLETQLALFDLVRIDHFRGFEACWEIPASCDTAIEGRWKTAPGEQLFDSMAAHFTELPLVAEDLGIITEEVTALREKYGMPGMKVLQFAFGGDASNPYLPHHQNIDSVTYTGTHDNNTTLGWYQELDERTKEHVKQYYGETGEGMPWLFIRSALRSVSQLAVIPLQDVLELDGQHRMNVPGTTEGNWQWKFDWSMFKAEYTSRIRQLNQLYDRH